MSIQPRASSESAAAGGARREALVVLGLTVVALVPRFLGFGREGLTHFDEGVYALSGLWSVSPHGLRGLDPGVIPYAPAGWPVLIGLAYSVFGVSDAAALVAAGVCGVLTVPVAAWVGRRTFGPGAGAAAAALAALSLAHVAFSRKALTDAPFLLAWLAALGLGGRLLERPGAGRALGFGLAVGLAQNVKYNGWVALVVVGLAAAAGLAVDPACRRRATVARLLGWGVAAAAVAGLMYAPWYRFVEAHGGYAALVRHHRGYVGGLPTWLPQWRQQLAQVVALSGGMAVGAVAWTVAWVGAGVSVHGAALVRPPTPWDAARLRLGWALGAAALATLPDLAWWVGLAWSGWLLFDRLPDRRVLGAWWIVLSVLTPFYHPYARLWLPLHAAGWVMLAGGVVAFGPFPWSEWTGTGGQVWMRKRVLAQGAVSLVCLVVARVHWRGDPPRSVAVADVLAPTDGFRAAVTQVDRFPPFGDNPRADLLVLGRRPLAYYLALRGRRFTLGASEDDVARGPAGPDDWALVDGVLLGEGLQEASRWKVLERRWASRLAVDLDLDPVTRLDVNPAAPFDHYPPDPVQLRLLAPRPWRPTPP